MPAQRGGTQLTPQPADSEAEAFIARLRRLREARLEEARLEEARLADAERSDVDLRSSDEDVAALDGGAEALDRGGIGDVELHGAVTRLGCQ
jgi:hypothetical protein